MTASDELRVFLIAGEESGDRLGGFLMRALKEATGGAVRFSGVGGLDMTAEGLASLFPIDTTSLIGFAGIPARALNYARRIRATARAAIAARPDVLVIIDSPEFTHRVARRVRRGLPSLPIVDYVAPSVWAWRPGRARTMRGYVDRVMALLPFEPEVFAKLGGPPCSFVGHPLGERVSALRPDQQERARRETAPPLVLVMPGSRRGELARMLDLFHKAIETIADRVGPAEFVMPAVPALAQMLRDAVSRWRVPVRVVSTPQEKDAAFRVARLALVKSGTSTLELAVAGIPMVAIYKVSPIEAFVGRRMLQVPSVILANLVLGENVVPEFLQERATVANIVNAALPLFGDTPERARQLDAFRRLDAIMEIGSASPSARAAAIVLEAARPR